MNPILEVENLSVRYEPKAHRAITAVSDVSFTLRPGEFVGIIGESGSGKTTLGNAVLRLLEKPARISEGTITFDGKDITTTPEGELRHLRWRDISTVFQSSMNSLNPVVRVDAQFADVIEEHSELRGDAVDARIGELFDMVLIDRKFMKAFPHELSGGMKQRVNLALALALDPKVVLLDEPTTGLDVVVQHSILENVRRLQKEKGFAVLFISHDIGTVLDLSDRLLVMYAGRIVEERATKDLLTDPLHPYTKGLLGSYSDPRAETVRITYIPGRLPDLSRPVEGCVFVARCPERIARCESVTPVFAPLDGGEVACHVARIQRGADEGGADAAGIGERTRTFNGPEFVKTADESAKALEHPPLLSVEGVTKVYERRRGFTVERTTAVEDVSFTLRRGEVTALVGQSGSGKSTLARLITGVDKPTEGRIVFHAEGGDREVAGYRGRALREYRSHVQMVFQDPYSSLNPTKRIGQTLERPLVNYQKLKGDALRARVRSCSRRWRSRRPTASSTATPTSSRAASASASSSPGPSPSSPRSSSPTSRSRASTCRSAPRCSSSSRPSCASATWGSSTSPTTCSARGCSPTRCSSSTRAGSSSADRPSTSSGRRRTRTPRSSSVRGAQPVRLTHLAAGPTAAAVDSGLTSPGTAGWVTAEGGPVASDDGDRPVTIYTVAERAGVSIATVSRVLKGSTPASPMTRRKVLRAVEELDYVPLRSSRPVDVPRHQTHGLVLPGLTVPTSPTCSPASSPPPPSTASRSSSSWPTAPSTSRPRCAPSSSGSTGS